jgi:hypothetical protein
MTDQARGEVGERPAAASAVTPATVKAGLGYPNDRVEESPTPIGWQGFDTDNFENVSRETSSGNGAV